MNTIPVLLIVLSGVLLFLGASFLWDRSPEKHGNLILSVLFLLSGMPALVY